MTGKYEVIVKNARLQYKFTIERNITILKGDSATGKTTLIDMIAAYQRLGAGSGIEIVSRKPCVVLTSVNWEVNLAQIQNSIVFIDEGDPFVKSVDFARAIQNTDNYYVIATRVPLTTLPYSVKEVYGIKNKSGNRYQGTKRLYSEFYPINKSPMPDTIEKPNVVIVEDSHSGYEFFSAVCAKYHVTCLSAQGKNNIFHMINNSDYENILVIADGAAFGSEIEKLIKLQQQKSIVIYLPESFEWLILKSGNVSGVSGILDEPYNYADSCRYFSWEQFFTELLCNSTRESYLRYSKTNLNKKYLQERETNKILSVIPKIDW